MVLVSRKCAAVVTCPTVKKLLRTRKWQLRKDSGRMSVSVPESRLSCVEHHTFLVESPIKSTRIYFGLNRLCKYVGSIVSPAPYCLIRNPVDTSFFFCWQLGWQQPASECGRLRYCRCSPCLPVGWPLSRVVPVDWKGRWCCSRSLCCQPYSSVSAETRYRRINRSSVFGNHLIM